MRIVFSHGKESGPKATKILAMQSVAERLGIPSISVDYQGLETVSERVDKLLLSTSSNIDPLVLVGSSMGAYASIAAQQRLSTVQGLFLLAPAVGLPGYETDGIKSLPEKTVVIHGWQDEIIPVNNAISFCRQHSISALLLKDDHRLSQSVELICKQFELFLKSAKA
ncbi:MAG: hypothetical protein OQK04_08460 [Kangiellaceae bacterium]|nr:hypothetical protein [Kangiellaceae bacterium]MCW8998731.1 hypothetical protein [Kangiellaceae bacterium]